MKWYDMFESKKSDDKQWDEIKDISSIKALSEEFEGIRDLENPIVYGWFWLPYGNCFGAAQDEEDLFNIGSQRLGNILIATPTIGYLIEERSDFTPISVVPVGAYREVFRFVEGKFDQENSYFQKAILRYRDERERQRKTNPETGWVWGTNNPEEDRRTSVIDKSKRYGFNKGTPKEALKYHGKRLVDMLNYTRKEHEALIREMFREIIGGSQ